jgi:hypothetical protein
MGRHQRLGWASNHKDAHSVYSHSNPSRKHSNLFEYCTAVTTVEVVSQSLGTPFLEPIVNTTRSLLGAVQVDFQHSGALELTTTHQTIKKNKDMYTEMLKQIHKILYAIIRVHITSNTSGELTPKMLDNLGQSAEYL